MNRTKIEWVKNPDGTQGYTWNPITGCLNGCEYCYARKLANGRLKSRYLANKNLSYDYLEIKKAFDKREPFDDPFYPRFWPERLSQPLATMRATRRGYQYWSQKSKGIFVCDMSDLFGIGIPENWQAQVFQVFHDCPNHRFYLLTKQPQNLIKFSPFPENCWVGVSVTNNYTYIGDFAKVEAGLKFLSIEPLLKWDDLPAQRERFSELLREKLGIKWVIIGAQTEPYRPPKIEGVREIVQACDKAGIPVFLKDNLQPILPPEVPTFYSLNLTTLHDDGQSEYEPMLKQEMPK